jgi:hypothetical protein
MAVEMPPFYPAEEIVSEPVCLHHTRVERISDAVLAGDMKKIRVERLEPLQKRLEPRVGDAFLYMRRDLSRSVRPTVMQSVRPESVPAALYHPLIRESIHSIDFPFASVLA